MQTNIFYLSVKGRDILLTDSIQLTQNDIPQLQPEHYDGVVAQVSPNPQNPEILGLKNCSTQSWIATLPNKKIRTIEVGKTIKLEKNTKIDFGSVNAVITSKKSKANTSGNKISLHRNIILASVILPILLIAGISFWQNSTSYGNISREAALEVVKQWFEYKRVLFSNPYDTSQIAEILTEKQSNDAYASVNWLKKYNSEYSYGVQRIDSIDSFESSGDRASIFVTITEHLTLHQPAGSKPSGGKRKARYDLVYENGKIKISDALILHKYLE